ncbi:MAG: S1 RNA-binding domain-containing protein [Oscillospiraceae bacterium]
MQIAVGSICEGKVTGITKFGAFVDLGDGQTGMVHISEVAQSYVNEIKDHLQLEQVVKVKVISVSEDGKISLSIKKAMPKPEFPRNDRFNRDDNRGDRKPFSRPSGNFRNNDYRRNQNNSQPSGTGKNIDSFEFSSNKRRDSNSFEDMMSKFKQSSEDKMSDLKKTMDVKRGSANRRSKPQ